MSCTGEDLLLLHAENVQNAAHARSAHSSKMLDPVILAWSIQI